MIIVGIDGKLTASGYAIGTGDGGLLAAGVAKVPAKIRDLAERAQYQIGHILNELAICGVDFPDLVAVELPRVYPGGRNRTDPNDIVDLAGLSLGIAYGLTPDRVLAPYPRTWKGTVPKDVHHRRLAAQYPLAVPLVNQTTPSRRNDVWDAVGLYCWGLAQR